MLQSKETETILGIVFPRGFIIDVLETSERKNTMNGSGGKADKCVIVMILVSEIRRYATYVSTWA